MIINKLLLQRVHLLLLWQENKTTNSGVWWK